MGQFLQDSLKRIAGIWSLETYGHSPHSPDTGGVHTTVVKVCCEEMSLRKGQSVEFHRQNHPLIQIIELSLFGQTN